MTLVKEARHEPTHRGFFVQLDGRVLRQIASVQVTGREFRANRLRLDLTQEALAQRLEVGRTTIYRLERRRKVPAVYALAITQLEIQAGGRGSMRKEG